MQDTSAMSIRPVMFHLLVKRWRAYLGVTQKEFANLWGVSASMVQKIETEDYSVGQLSFERLEGLRTLLQLSAAEFYSILSGETTDDLP
jgi:transcriptional regulator with XRE-family HTH domain